MGGRRGRLHEFRAVFLFEQCVVSFFPLKPFWLKTDLDLDLGEGSDNCTYHSKKTNILFCGQYISSQMTSEGSLLIFLFFFLLDS